MSENFKRITKDIVILLLLALSAVLVWLNWFSSPPKIAGDKHSSFARFVSTVLGAEKEDSAAASYNAYQEYAYTFSTICPQTVVVRSGADVYLYAQHTDIEVLFDRIKQSLSAAFNTAEKNYAVNTAHWRSCLQKPMILMSFPGDMPLYYISAVLGVPQTDKMDYEINYLLLDLSEETVTINIKTTDGDIYSCDTGLRSINIDALISGKEPEDVFFACQNPYTANRIPDETILFDRSVSIPNIKVSAAIQSFSGGGAERKIDNILSSFGFNPYSTNSYIEPDSARVYVEQLKTLRIAPEGTLVYDSGSQNELKPMKLMEISVRAQNINNSAQIVEQAIAPNLGAASVYIKRQYYDDVSGNYVVVFSVQYSGMKIDLPEGYLARFEYRGTELVKAYVNLYTFELTDDSDTLLPSVYAAASVSGRPFASAFEGRYTVKNGIARADWYYY